MKKFTEFLAESGPNERMMKMARKLAVDPQPIRKVGGWSYKVGNFVFGDKGGGQWQITKNGKEVDYLFGKKDGDIASLMADYAEKK